MARLLEGTIFDRPPRCERCDKLLSECQCPPTPPSSTFIAASRQTAKLREERRTAGKWVTVVDGLGPKETDLPALLAQLKGSCGAGGTLKDDHIEIQGRHRDRLRELLAGMGYRVKG